MTYQDWTFSHKRPYPASISVAKFSLTNMGAGPCLWYPFLCPPPPPSTHPSPNKAMFSSAKPTRNALQGLFLNSYHKYMHKAWQNERLLLTLKKWAVFSDLPGKSSCGYWRAERNAYLLHSHVSTVKKYLHCEQQTATLTNCCLLTSPCFWSIVKS